MKILFVCLGNICRSPMAEGILKNMMAGKNEKWQIDSAGVESYHVGERPDSRAIRTCRKHGVDISLQQARRITENDFYEFDLIYALSTDVLGELKGMKPRSGKSTVMLILDEVHPGQNRSVPDPWYGNEAGFEPVFGMLEEACKGILAKYS